MTFLDAQICIVRRYRMNLGLWAACSQGHKQLVMRFSTQIFSPCRWDFLSCNGRDLHSELGCSSIEWLLSCLCLYLTLLSALVQTSLLVQTPLFLLCTTVVDNAISRDAQNRKDLPPSSPVSCHRPCIHHVCFCPAPEDRKKLSQFQAPSCSLFYLSLGIILTLFITLACSSSLRSLVLWVVTAALYVTLLSPTSPCWPMLLPLLQLKKLKSLEHFSAI